MKYELDSRGRKVPIVHCGNCHKKMVVDDIDGVGKRATFYMMCSDDNCKSWCRIQYDKILDYGICED